MTAAISLAGQTTLVTGASRGIGRAVAFALAEAGAEVVINYSRSPEAAEAAATSINEAGGHAWTLQADVADEQAVNKMVSDVLERSNRLDVLVNNAGITRDGLLMRMKTADWQSVIDLNLNGVFLCSRAAARPMLKQRGGRIVNITSVVGLMDPSQRHPTVNHRS